VDILTIFLIALGLAMDAFAASVAKGITFKKDKHKSAILLASLFGSFQMIMPIIGWAAGLSFKEVIVGIDHWIAFGLLGFIGVKMIYESSKNADNKKEDSIKLSSAFVLAVATSIDALMVGLSFAFLEISIALPIALIGAVTFILSFVGFIFGCGLGKIFGKKIEVIGGVILIVIGIRILIEHLL